MAQTEILGSKSLPESPAGFCNRFRYNDTLREGPLLPPLM